MVATRIWSEVLLADIQCFALVLLLPVSLVSVVHVGRANADRRLAHVVFGLLLKVRIHREQIAVRRLVNRGRFNLLVLAFRQLACLGNRGLSYQLLEGLKLLDGFSKMAKQFWLRKIGGAIQAFLHCDAWSLALLNGLLRN